MLNPYESGRVLERALECGADFCEIFMEDRDETNISLESGRIKNVTGVHMYGAGLYLLRGTASVYVYTSDVTEAGLMRLLQRGAQFLPQGKGGERAAFRDVPVADPCPVRRYPGAVAVRDKIARLAETEKVVAAHAPLTLKSDYAYFDTDQRIIVAASDGTWAEDRRVTTRIRGRFGITANGESAGDWTDFAAPAGIESLENGRHIELFGQFVRQLGESMTAEEAPKGRFPVVFAGAGCVGTFFHEACGHQLETTNMQAESAYFRDKLGKRVAAPCVTLVDDGTIPGAYGSSGIDDEGMPRQRNVLIENGVLRSFLVDRLGSRQFGVPRTGSGRRQNYTFAPAARMSNTYLAAGSDDPEAMIREIPLGIYAENIGGGTGGEEFTLLCPRAWLIKDGRLDRLLKSAMLLGRGDETMLAVDRVSRDMEWEEGGAFCGAASGLVNTTTSGARMRVTEMVVG